MRENVANYGGDGIMSEDKDVAEVFGDALNDAIMDITDRERYKKARQSFMDDMFDEIQYSIIDRMPETLEMLVRDMADRAVDAMLKGQPQEVNRYLKLDGWTGRERDHQVIHGKLNVPQTMELRSKVAKANEKLLRDEVILDLEDQVESLVNTVNKQSQEIEDLRDKIYR